MRVQCRNLNGRGEHQQALRVAVLIRVKHEGGAGRVGRVNTHQQHGRRGHQRAEQHLHVVLHQRHLRAVITGRSDNPVHLSALNVALVIGARVNHNQVQCLIAEEVNEDLHRRFAQNQLVTLGFLTYVALTNVLGGGEHAQRLHAGLGHANDLVGQHRIGAHRVGLGGNEQGTGSVEQNVTTEHRTNHVNEGSLLHVITEGFQSGDQVRVRNLMLARRQRSGGRVAGTALHTLTSPLRDTRSIARELSQVLTHVGCGQGAFILPASRLIITVIGGTHAELRVGPAGSRHHDGGGKPGAAVTVVGGALQLANLSNNGRAVLERTDGANELFTVAEFTHAHENLTCQRFNVQHHFAPARVNTNDIQQPASNVVQRVLDARGTATRLGEAGFSHSSYILECEYGAAGGIRVRS